MEKLRGELRVGLNASHARGGKEHEFRGVLLEEAIDGKAVLEVEGLASWRQDVVVAGIAEPPDDGAPREPC